MKRYSASYVYRQSNFVLIGCDEPEDTRSEWYDLASVALNIIQRGTPTPATERLRMLLGDAPEELKTIQRPVRRVVTHEPRWGRTIKGAPDGRQNPAKLFYEELLPEALPIDHRFIMSYLLPEALITDIVKDCDPRFTDQRVDFYCPRAKLAIEIDGSQHGHAAQSYLDIERDMYLRQNGIETIRITTSNLYASEAARALVERFDCGDSLPPEMDEREELAVFGYEIAMRTQVAVIECVRSGILDLSRRIWGIELVHDQPGIDCGSVVEAAVEDVLDIFENLCALLGKDFKRPEVLLRAGADDLSLDVSATKCWSELESRSGVVYTRNDYYEDRDNFRVACGSFIEYDTITPKDEGQVKKALLYFLKYLFGYEGFNPGQEKIIRRALARKPTLGILPTGSGKSLCYQMACLLQPRISFVVCPIISLIQDQDYNAREAGICRASRIESQMDAGDKFEVLERFGQLRYQFIWISPERFQMESYREKLREIGNKAGFGYAVIDEAHCLSEWGHDFRVSYLRLHDTIKVYCPEAVTLALTATASRNVLEDLLSELDITKRDVQTSPSLDRPELTYHVVKIRENDRERALDAILDEVDETFRRREGVDTVFEPAGEAGRDSICGIVFSNMKSNKRRPYATCSGVISLLRRRGIKADEYHADRGDSRTGVQKAFIDNEFTVMAATKAFGMGVNKKNVRYTIHDGLPWSIEAFYQEAGRAGRDKKRNKSECYILYSNDSSADVVERVFAADTPVEEIRASIDELDGDLGTLFFLWSRNHEDVDVEVQAILGVYSELAGRPRELDGTIFVEENLVRDKVWDMVLARLKPGAKAELYMETQDALYKLALLGIVRDWTVDYRGHTHYQVRLEDLDVPVEVQAKEKLEEYIRRHDPLFSFESRRQDDKKYIEPYLQARDEDKLNRIVEALLVWSNDHIVYSRRQAIKNMLDQCERRPNKDEFRKYINDFFRLDTEGGDQLDAILETTDDLDIWVRLFTRLDDDPHNQREVLKSTDEIKTISALCDRYRESYHANVGLEWATMVARLLSGEFSRRETTDLFSLVMRGATDYEELDAEELLDKTLYLVGYASREARDAFGAAVVAHAPERAMDVYERIGDMSTLGHLVSVAASKLRKTWGRTRSI